MRRRFNLDTNPGMSSKSTDRTNPGHPLKKWSKKRKPQLAPLVILDTPLKSSISDEKILEAVRFVIRESKLKN